MLNRFIVASIGTLALAATAFAQPAAKPAPTTGAKSAMPAPPPTTTTSTDHIMITPKQIKWVDAPPSLPKGAKAAVIEGDPSKAGPFTMRLQVPAGYKIPAHTHPALEHVTVLTGEAYMGMGDTLDAKAATKLSVGSFAVMPVGHTHYFFVKRKTEIQLHSIGPWGITYVNPADDPRNAAPAATSTTAPAKAAAPAPAKPAAPAKKM
ncbi:MAG TPA: cupin domain-containing protein [Kofleriaceae bacterium]|jgi:mannose-6-phosphate isomerase-like protein (cupin superfamily)|nr:cupin domain-containing protein [Kofleriaceae bacterium]